MQIVNAPKKSHKARLVSYADKLYNLRDLSETTPAGWSQERVHEYFEWSAKVVQHMLGANQRLEAKLEEILMTRGISLHNAENFEWTWNFCAMHNLTVNHSRSVIDCFITAIIHLCKTIFNTCTPWYYVFDLLNCYNEHDNEVWV